MNKGTGSPGDAAARARLILASVLVLGGCVVGDAALDSPSDEPGPAGEPPAALMARLNRMNVLSLTSTRWQLALVDSCTLRVEAQQPGGGTELGLVDLLAIDVQIKGNLGGTMQAVQVDRSGHRTLDSEHLFEAERWTDAVEYASAVKTLQRACASRS